MIILVFQIKLPFIHTEERNGHQHIKCKLTYCHYSCFRPLVLWEINNFASSYCVYTARV